VSARGSGRKDCHERALGLLAVRARSRRELEHRLLRAGFEPTEVSDELRRLESVGLIDDPAFARQVAEQAFGANKSRRAVAAALAAKGVARDTASAATEGLGGDEQRRADELAAAKATRLRGLDPHKAFQRLYGLLARRGYGSDVARSAARKALVIAESVEDWPHARS
jgi:regulatory protein